jgi:hypothetical protein
MILQTLRDRPAGRVRQSRHNNTTGLRETKQGPACGRAVTMRVDTAVVGAEAGLAESSEVMSVARPQHPSGGRDDRPNFPIVGSPNRGFTKICEPEDRARRNDAPSS